MYSLHTGRYFDSAQDMIFVVQHLLACSQAHLSVFYLVRIWLFVLYFWSCLCIFPPALNETLAWIIYLQVTFFPNGSLLMLGRGGNPKRYCHTKC